MPARVASCANAPRSPFYSPVWFRSVKGSAPSFLMPRLGASVTFYRQYAATPTMVFLKEDTRARQTVPGSSRDSFILLDAPPELGVTRSDARLGGVRRSQDRLARDAARGPGAMWTSPAIAHLKFRESAHDCLFRAFEIYPPPSRTRGGFRGWRGVNAALSVACQVGSLGRVASSRAQDKTIALERYGA